MATKIICPKCGSTNVNVTFVQDQKLKNDHGSCLYWLLIGWWWKPIKWFLFWLPSFFALFFPKKQKLVTKNKKTCICQDCGYSWEIK